MHRRLPLLALVLLCALPLRSALSQTTRCGVERWPVKILADPDAQQVNRDPLPATVTQLRGLQRQPGALPLRGRLSGPERQVFRVRATVTRIITEDDGDWHLVLADPDNPSATMVAEIPDSACAYGTPDASRFAAARRDMHAAGRNALVEFDGVGFYDFLHGQRGMAPNGVEIHPVLHVRVLAASGPAVAPVAGSGAERPGTARHRSDRSALPTASNEPPDPDHQGHGGDVWLNTSSLVYHCPGTRYYGATAHGEYVTEAEAVRRGARPVGGRRCG
jgi:hypothetical protein